MCRDLDIEADFRQKSIANASSFSIYLTAKFHALKYYVLISTIVELFFLFFRNRFWPDSSLPFHYSFLYFVFTLVHTFPKIDILRTYYTFR